MQQPKQQSTITCDQLGNCIDAFLLDSLDAESRQQVIDHLNQCPSCRREVDRAAQLLDALVGVARPERPALPMPSRNTLQHLARETRRARRRSRVARLCRWAGVAAAGVLVCMVIQRQLRNPPPDRPPEPAGPIWARSGVVACRGRGAAYPVVTGGKVLAFEGTERNRRLVAFSAADGTVQWHSRVRIGGCSLAASGNRVFAWTVTPSGEQLTALDTTSGRAVWQRKQTRDGSPLTRGRLAALPKSVCIATPNSVIALDALTGRELWTVQPKGRRGLSAPVPLGNHVVVAHGRTVTALDADTGNIVWQTDVDAAERPLSPPCVQASADRIVVVSNPLSPTGALHCLDAKAGAVLWERDIPGPVQSLVLTKNLYLRTDDIVALDAATGRTLWSAPMGGCSPLLALRDSIVASEGNGTPALVAFDDKTGIRLWERRLASSCSGLAVDGKTGFMAARNGALYAMRIAPPDQV